MRLVANVMVSTSFEEVTRPENEARLCKETSGIGAADRIPVTQKGAFAAGAGADVFGYQVVTDRLWLPFFNIGLGLSPALAGALLMYFRLLEALISPVIGSLSDNTRTRWGRRRPWLFAGAVLMALSLPAMFSASRDWDRRDIILYTVATGTLLFGSYKIWSVPYFSLGLEMTPSYDERTRLGAWMAIANKLLTIPAGWILLFASSAWFVDQATGKPDLVAGARGFGWAFAPVVLICGLLPALFVRERYYEAEAAKQPKESLWKGIRESAACAQLWPLLIASALLVMGFYATSAVGVYVNIYYVFDGDVAAATAMEGVKNTVAFAVGLLAVPPLVRLSERFDKRSVTIALVAAAAVAQLSNLVLMRPDMPYLQILPAIISAGVATSVWMFLPSMKADIADYDELRSGKRREGSLNAFYGLFFKLAMMLAAGMGGALLQATGFDVAAPSQSPTVLRSMLVAYSVVPALIWIACIAAFLFYRLDRPALAAIREKLEARRGQV